MWKLIIPIYNARIKINLENHDIAYPKMNNKQFKLVIIKQNHETNNWAIRLKYNKLHNANAQLSEVIKIS